MSESTTYWRHPGYPGQEPFVFQVDPIPAGEVPVDGLVCEAEDSGSPCSPEYAYAMVKNDLAVMFCTKHATEGAKQITKDQFDASEEY